MKRRINSHRRTALLAPKHYQKKIKILLVPKVIKKHPKTATAGLAALGLGLATGLLLYNMSHRK